MATQLVAVNALARATAMELLRRPGLLLATGGVGCLLLVLHDLSATAFDETGALAMEFSLATVALFGSLVAGLVGVRSCSAGSDLGPAPELSTAPLGDAGYLAARFTGTAFALGILLAALGCVAALAHLMAGAPPLEGSAVLLAAAGVAWQAAVFFALGALLGAIAPFQLAAILLVTALIAARTLVPALASADGGLDWLAATLPDPARVDLSREVGFGQALDLSSVLLAWTATAAQITALLVLAHAALHLRRR